jgi:hypothetical protein
LGFKNAGRTYARRSSPKATGTSDHRWSVSENSESIS